MTDMAAVIGIKQLEKLAEGIKKRRKNADFLTRELSIINGIQLPAIRNNVAHSFHQYSILLDPSKLQYTRDEFAQALRAENIDCAVHYPIPLTKQPVFKELAQRCPVAEDDSERILSLPVHPYLSEEDLSKVVAGVKKVAENYSK
jgi:dTDP-4-amino-4,6-dideoxygalactose transaminase